MNTYIPNELQFFQHSEINLTTLENSFKYVHPITPISENLESSVEFHISGNSQKLIDLSNLFIYVKGQLVKRNATEELFKPEEKNGRIANNIIGSLIKSCSIAINNVIVADYQSLYSYKDYFEVLCQYSDETIHAFLNNSGIFAIDDAKANLTSLCASSHVFDLVAKFNILQLTQCVIPNTNISIKITFNPQSFFVIEEDSAVNSRFRLRDFKLKYKEYHIRESFAIQLENALIKSPAIYNFKKPVMLATTIPANLTQISLPNIFYGSSMSIVIAAFIKTATIAGSFTTNPLDLKHHDLKSFSFLIDGSRKPENGFEFDFSNTNTTYADLFHSTMDSLNLLNSNEANMLVSTEYKDRFIIAQDISSTCSGNSSFLSPLKYQNLGFELSFTKAIEESITVVMYILCDNQFTINSHRNVTIVY